MVKYPEGIAEKSLEELPEEPLVNFKGNFLINAWENPWEAYRGLSEEKKNTIEKFL